MFPEDEAGSVVSAGSETATTTVPAPAESTLPVEAAPPDVVSETADKSELTPEAAADELLFSAELGSALEPAESAEISDEMMTGIGDVPGLTPGQVKKGFVVKVTDAEIMVDIGLKSEGAIPRSEFVAEDGQLTVKPGDEVDVLIEEYDEQEGTFTVSHRKAVVLRAWQDLEIAWRDHTNVKGCVVERTKGGLIVSVSGVRAFLPASQADVRPLRNPDSLIGQEDEFKVIKLNHGRNNVVVSRKAYLEEEAARRKAELAERLVEGAEVTGTVKNLTSYGAFIDLGGMDGLLHVTDLAWGRVAHPSEVVQVGQELRVKVLKYDREKERISLGLKQLVPDPWDRVVAYYRPGDKLAGKVVSLTDYGAFCELEPGIEGLIHVSEMTWSRYHKHPSKFVKPGDPVEVSILEVNSKQRRISLSLRQTMDDPWTTLADRLRPGQTVDGRVRNLTDYGAFVEIEDGIEGLIHVSDLSWTRNIKHPSEVLKKGQKIRAAVVSIDPKLRRISLGLKQLEPDAWQTFFEQTPVGTVLSGKVVRLAQFGAFVELREGIEGLCHLSEMGEEHSRGGRKPLKVGEELSFRVIRVNPEERRIGLSLKEVEEHVPVPETPKPSAAIAPESGASQGSTTMGQKMAQAIQAAAARSAARAVPRPAPRPVEPPPQPEQKAHAQAATSELPVKSAAAPVEDSAASALVPSATSNGSEHASGTSLEPPPAAREVLPDAPESAPAGPSPIRESAVAATATADNLNAETVQESLDVPSEVRS
jgi:small subunit ribosomal protein S1